jgi:protein-S-isoprenylcysteine O-methyltransferase Ste14
MLAFKTVFLLIVMPGITLLYIPLKIVSSPVNIEFQLYLVRYAAFFLWGLGAIISSWCVWDFYSKGEGTPAPIDPPKNLVISGLYSYVRNPMYTGILSILLGHIIWFESLALMVYFAVLFGIFHLFVLYYEEPHLTETFGPSYKNYMKKVPRWLPRMKRPKGEQNDRHT